MKSFITPDKARELNEGLDRQIKELKEKGIDKILEKHQGKEKAVKPILDVNVFELWKAQNLAIASGNEADIMAVNGEIWNYLLEKTYDNALNLRQLKAAQNKIDELTKKLQS